MRVVKAFIHYNFKENDLRAVLITPNGTRFEETFELALEAFGWVNSWIDAGDHIELHEKSTYNEKYDFKGSGKIKKSIITRKPISLSQMTDDQFAEMMEPKEYTTL